MNYFALSFRRHVWLVVAVLCVLGVLGCGAATVQAAGGDVDTGFAPNATQPSNVQAMAVQPDGKVIIGGQFTTVNGVARGRIARLNADGTLDTGFLNGLSGANNVVIAVAVQADGKVIIGGNFTAVNRLAADRPTRHYPRRQSARTALQRLRLGQ